MTFIADASEEELVNLLEEALKMVRAGRYRYLVRGIGLMDGPGLGGPVESA